MSIEIFVMSERRLGSIAEWQKAIEQEGFNLRLDASRPLEAIGGHLPAWRGSEPAGYECDHSDPADLLDDDDLADIDFHRPWSQTLAFRFGRDFLALWVIRGGDGLRAGDRRRGVRWRGRRSPDARQGRRNSTRRRAGIGKDVASPGATTVRVGLLVSDGQFVWDGQFRARVVASALRDSRVRFPRYALSFTSVSGRSFPEAVSVCHLPFASSYWITSV